MNQLRNFKNPERENHSPRYVKQETCRLDTHANMSHMMTCLDLMLPMT
jgi:hypothetical protein